MSARISPGASLLRNSKLFALPPTIALPSAPPSSQQIFNSDTATTLYPSHAAIQTTGTSLIRGDWGFKRPLPARAFNRTNNPVIRLVRGIDTPEHTADFESAADHALTLRKFQELNHPLRLPDSPRAHRSFSTDRRDLSVFRATHDNTTNTSSSAPAHNNTNGVWPRIPAEQVSQRIPKTIKEGQAVYEERKKAEEARSPIDRSGARALSELSQYTAPPRAPDVRRWRYKGPSLTQMTGLEFDEYVESLGQKEKEMLQVRVRKEIIRELRSRARDDGNMEQAIREENITEEQMAEYMRRLRRDPRRFGPMIVEILDIPEGVSTTTSRDHSDAWDYGRETLASQDWTERGPPRTHPSAGLSYVHSTTHANNHPEYGPQRLNPAVLARAVKQKSKAGGADVNYGVAGFIVPKPETVSIQNAHEQFEPRSGGMKTPLRPGPAWITEDGALRMQTVRPGDYRVDDDKAVFSQDLMKKLHRQAMQDAQSQGSPVPSMSGVGATSTYSPSSSRRSRYAQTEGGRSSTRPDQDIGSILEQVGNLSSNRR